MKLHTLFSILTIGSALVGCANLEPFVAPNAQPSSSSGYVAGRFTLEKKVFATAFVLTNLSTQQEFVLPFTAKSDYPDGNTETGLVTMPPGTYKATHWIVYNTFWGPSAGGREFKRPLQESNFTKPFELRPGEVVFLGRFVANNSWQLGYMKSTTFGRWAAEELSVEEAQDFVRASYPAFGSLKITCLACSR